MNFLSEMEKESRHQLCFLSGENTFNNLTLELGTGRVLAQQTVSSGTTLISGRPWKAMQAQRSDAPQLQWDCLLVTSHTCQR